jgi:ATP-dependent Clp protease adaptor protein ClpS
MDEFRDDNFNMGVEILNDNTTPMEFVVDVLMKYLEIEKEDAIKWMLAIHSYGGALYPTETMEKAEAIAQGISKDATAKGHRLICRAVSR